jgi:hypothetical protein
MVPVSGCGARTANFSAPTLLSHDSVRVPGSFVRVKRPHNAAAGSDKI